MSTPVTDPGGTSFPSIGAALAAHDVPRHRFDWWRTRGMTPGEALAAAIARKPVRLPPADVSKLRPVEVARAETLRWVAHLLEVEAVAALRLEGEARRRRDAIGAAQKAGERRGLERLRKRLLAAAKVRA